MHPITIVTGPPGAGKTTLARALVCASERGVHIPVDDMRLWVVSGLHDSIPWTDETERQFQIAEESAMAVALRYQVAGFAVAIDHCRNVSRIDAFTAGHPVRKVLLLPDLAVNLERNLARTNKDFDPAVLSETIRFTHEAYRRANHTGWLVIDNTHLTVEETVRQII